MPSFRYALKPSRFSFASCRDVWQVSKSRPIRSSQRSKSIAGGRLTMKDGCIVSWSPNPLIRHKFARISFFSVPCCSSSFTVERISKSPIHGCSLLHIAIIVGRAFCGAALTDAASLSTSNLLKAASEGDAQ